MTNYIGTMTPEEEAEWKRLDQPRATARPAPDIRPAVVRMLANNLRANAYDVAARTMEDLLARVEFLETVQPAASAEPPPAAEPSDKDRAKLMELVLRYGDTRNIQGWYEAKGNHEEFLRRSNEAVRRAKDVKDFARALLARYGKPIAGEDIMINVEGDDVYTLPLQPSGMAMPRFVVHVPAAQPKRRPYNASGSLSEYGVFPECDAAQPETSGNAGDVPPEWKTAVQAAYGHLWRVNNEPRTPNRYSSEQAAYAARRLLRGLLTRDERGAGINAARQGDGGAA